jgi:hypothetical protein
MGSESFHVSGFQPLHSAGTRDVASVTTQYNVARNFNHATTVAAVSC